MSNDNVEDVMFGFAQKHRSFSHRRRRRRMRLIWKWEEVLRILEK